MAVVRKSVIPVVLLSLLAGCGSAAEAGPGPTATTVKNCGIDVVVDGPPKRVFAAYQPAIEMAHALGISDRLVGTAYLDAEVLPPYASAQQKAKYYKNLPSREELLSLNPDFVLSGFNDVFSATGSDSSFGGRKSLADLGVQTWIFSPLCPTADGKGDEAIDPATVSMDNVYADLRDLGRLFQAEDRAEAVIADQQARIAAVEAKVKGAPRPTVAILRPGLEGGGMTVSGGPDFGTVLIRQAGGVNAFADLTWPTGRSTSCPAVNASVCGSLSHSPRTPTRCSSTSRPPSSISPTSWRFSTWSRTSTATTARRSCSSSTTSTSPPATPTT